MSTHRTTLLLGALAVGMVLSQQACSSATTTPAAVSSAPAASPSPVASSSSSSPSSSSSGDVFSGERQVVIRPVEVQESIVVVNDRGRLSFTDGEAEHGLFVFTPVRDRFQIKTAKADASGEPSCLGIKENGSNPLTVEAAACDTSRDGQLFTVTEQDASAEGRPTYAIANGDAFVQIFPETGLIAQELGDAPLATTYAFVDNGPSTLPALD